VVKGDNPVSIAHRLHVNYDALLELNGISDPRKLQIGTKLRIPERQANTKHKAN
jgi:LysM repeat protein